VATPLENWVAEAAKLTKPDRLVYCDGSEAEYQRMIAEMLRMGDSLELNEKTFPNCHLHRSSPNDVARTEHLTYICSTDKEDVDPTNNWMDPGAAKHKVGALLDGAMRGRTMYVVPYVMGPTASPISKIGVEVTDSPYVVTSMRIMSRMGNVAMERLGSSSEFVPGLHSLGDLDPMRRYIMHFPEEKLIWSVGSGYGGNALLGKKCFALRIASVMAREQGWMAEHMLILGLESPGGKVTYMGAAFPSACGKTNLAMMVSALENQGYRVWTVGDDISWMKIGEDGYLRAINPEAGFFGVAPGTGMKTNQNVMGALRKNTLFTNVAMTAEREPWWEGIGSDAPAGLINWKGEMWDPSKGAAAHPNARYTVPAAQSPSISAKWEAPEGVPISAFIFGGRRARVAPPAGAVMTVTVPSLTRSRSGMVQTSSAVRGAFGAGCCGARWAACGAALFANKHSPIEVNIKARIEIICEPPLWISASSIRRTSSRGNVHRACKGQRSVAAAALWLGTGTDMTSLSDVADQNPRVSNCHDSRLCSSIIEIESLWTGQGRICLILPSVHLHTIY